MVVQSTCYHLCNPWGVTQLLGMRKEARRGVLSRLRTRTARALMTLRQPKGSIWPLGLKCLTLAGWSVLLSITA